MLTYIAGPVEEVEGPEPAEEAETCSAPKWYNPFTWFNSSCAGEEKTIVATPEVATTMQVA